MSLSDIINRIEDKLALQTEETRKDLYKKSDIDLEEKFAYFETNARAFASGEIPYEVSQFVYNKLRTYEDTSLAERLVISQIMYELIQKRLASK